MTRRILLALFLCACGEGEISSGAAGEDFGSSGADVGGLGGLDGVGGFGTPEPRPDRLLPATGGSAAPADSGAGPRAGRVGGSADRTARAGRRRAAAARDRASAPTPHRAATTAAAGHTRLRLCVRQRPVLCVVRPRPRGPERVPRALAHEQPDALLRCTDAAWNVEQACEAGCEVRPPGEADRCANPPPGPDDGQWHLPWRCGDTYRCTQGNDGDICGGGVGSHTGRQRFAYDFGMPRGTSVVAARAGEVIFSDNRVGPGQDCYDGCNDQGCCDRCINTVNRVVLRHGDGTTSLYLHLDNASAQVGAMVSAGDQLGVSGISGCSFGAHLHFQVQSDCGIWFCDSQGIDFSENGDMACGAQNASGNCR